MLSSVMPATFDATGAHGVDGELVFQAVDLFGREAAEGEHAVLFDDEIEVLICAFGFEQLDEFLATLALMRPRISSSSAIHCAFKSASFNTRAMVFAPWEAGLE